MSYIFELLKSLPVPVLLTLSIFFVTIGDYIGKKWAIDGGYVYFLIACLSSLFSGLFYFPILLKEGLVVSSIIWTILSIVAFLVIGLVVFHEVLTPIQSVGVIVGIISVILLSL